MGQFVSGVAARGFSMAISGKYQWYRFEYATSV
jgi:hypothetical protein